MLHRIEYYFPHARNPILAIQPVAQLYEISLPTELRALHSTLALECTQPLTEMGIKQ
jgi:hypothetical protein